MGLVSDRIGRKTALVASVAMMCAGSLVIAATPGAAQIGIAAPIILLCARLLQGLSLGGEYGASATYMSEMAGAKHRGFDMTAWEIMDESLRESGMWDAETNWRKGGQDFHLGFETSHFLDGFAWPDGKFRFKPDWTAYGPRGKEMPVLPDHFDVIDNATDEKPFRLVAAPARTFLNSTFTETPSSQRREVRPTAMMNPEDCAAMGIAEGDRVEVGNERGKTIVNAKAKKGQQRGVVIVEGIWPNRNFETGIGINAVTSAEPGWPNGGAVFHDTAVWIKKL